MRFSICVFLALASFLMSSTKVEACTPYGTPIVNYTIVGNNLNVTVTSTTAWSCQYEFQLELICAAANFTGNAQYNRPQTPTISKPSPANLNYQVFTIDISTLCPGIQYKFRVREKVLSFSSWSNWSAVSTFTVPGPPYGVSVSADQTLLCPPDCANLTASSTNACGAVTYSWNQGLGTGANKVVCPTTPTTYTVTGSVNVPFCPIPITASASVSIGIEPPAVPGVASISTTQICSGDPVTLSLTGFTGNIQWQSSSSSGGPFEDIPGATTAVYTTGPITQNTFFQAYVSTCTDEYSNVINVQVFEIPTAAFTSVDVCFGQTMNFTDQSTDNISVTGWNWSFGDGSNSIQQNPSNLYTAPGDYTVTLEAINPNNCPNTTSTTVTVFPIPTASFTFNTVCEDQLSEMLSTSVVAGPSTITGYAWDITENGVVDYTTENITHNFNGFGNYNVSLTVTADGGCVNTFSDVIPVFPLPNVQFTATPLCLGEETTFTDQTTVPAGGSPVSWQWIFGDGNGDNLQNTTHTYANSNTYSVELIVESDNGCFANAVQDVDVFALPVAGINVNNECFYDALNFQNGSSGNSTAFQWSFGDGNTSNLENPAHQYINAGIYQVALIVNTLEGCADTIVQNVTAYAQPEANFSVDPSCVNSGNQFTDNSTINPVDGDQITGYSWSFGDGNTSSVASPSHDYDNEGVYNVNFLVTSNYGCINVFNSTATVWPLPESNFSPVDVCLGVSTEFSDLSQVSNINTTNSIDTWNWNFGEGGTSSQQNPIYTYNAPGTYNATLTVTTTNGCSDLTTLPVTVHPTPVASFTGQSLDGCSPICPSFTSTSTVDGPSTISNYNWILSNGMNQNSSNSEYTECLENSSSETITLGLTLIVTSDQGCTATYTEPTYINIYHNPIAEFYYTPNTLTTLNPEVEFINTSSYSDFYSWTFGNIGSSFETNPGFLFPEIGQETYDVTLIASTNFGCTDTAVAEVFIEDIIIFYVPNTFTPDQDVYNELFTPIFTSGFDPFDYHLTIFNRWGEIVFESFDHTQGWNGTYGVGSNRIAKEGTYTWKIEFKELMSDKRHQHHGHVNLLK